MTLLTATPVNSRANKYHRIAAALAQLSGTCTEPRRSGAEQPGPAGHSNPTPQTEKL